MGDDSSASHDAERIVLSYRSPEADADREQWQLVDNDWICDELRRDSYIGYLKTVHEGEIERGAEWDEFVSSGCASPTDVILRVEAVEGGTILGERTNVDIVHRRDVRVV